MTTAGEREQALVVARAIAADIKARERARLVEGLLRGDVLNHARNVLDDAWFAYRKEVSEAVDPQAIILEQAFEEMLGELRAEVGAPAPGTNPPGTNSEAAPAPAPTPIPLTAQASSLPAPRDPDSLPPGTQLDGRYEIVSLLGRGAMAAVYQARHLGLHSLHALKVLNLDLARNEDLRSRFLAEGRIQAQLKHPNIVQVTEIVTNPVAGLVMDFVEGDSLDRHLQALPGPP